jgi:hypothetical protein
MASESKACLGFSLGGVHLESRRVCAVRNGVAFTFIKSEDIRYRKQLRMSYSRTCGTRLASSERIA